MINIIEVLRVTVWFMVWIGLPVLAIVAMGILARRWEIERKAEEARNRQMAIRPMEQEFEQEQRKAA